MELFQAREREIFATLKAIQKLPFVIIGGYAVNTYTLPRFSIDCDIVIKNNKVLKKIIQVLQTLDYSENKASKTTTPYHGDFIRYKKI